MSAPAFDRPSRTEAETVARAQAGDQQAFTELVQRYQSDVTALVLALSASVSRSEELAQETFLVAWRKLRSLRDPTSFRSWLFVIARHLARRDQRGVQLQPARPAFSSRVDLPSSDPSPLERAISRDEERLLGEALRRVPKRYRMAIVLFYRDDQSVAQVAETLNLSEANAKMRLSRGRRMLHEKATLVESALRRARPGKAFTTAVTLAIAGASAGGADAAPDVDVEVDAAMPARRLPWRVVPWVGGAVFLGVLAAGYVKPKPSGGRAKGARVADVSEPVTPPAAASAPRGVPALIPTADLLPAVPTPERAVLPPRFDFEDGARPPELAWGQVVSSCPERDGSKFCAVSELSLELSRPYLGVRLSTGGRIAHAEGLELAFDYWLDGDDSYLVVQFSAADDHTQFYVRPKVVHGAWATASIAVAGARAETAAGGRAIAVGDPIHNIFVVRHPNAFPHRPFYVDNIRIGTGR